MNEQMMHLAKADFIEAMEMMQLAFGSFDFPASLPKLYKPNDEKMHWNLAVKAGGAIQAVVGAFPMTLIAGAHTLKTIGIGGVSVHPDARGRGYMRRLMDAAMEEMRASGIQLACLGGLRHRYSHWGFEKGGTKLEFQFNQGDMRHYGHSYHPEEIRFEPIETEDTDRLNQAAAFYRSQPVYVERPTDEFHAFLRSWSQRPWAAVCSNGDMVGYLTANEDGNIINEIGAETPHRIGQMLYAWTNTRHKYPKLLLLPWQRDWIEEVGKFAEECVLKEAYNFHVLDWPAVTDALLKVKASYSPLPDGEAVVQINGNVKLRLCVRNGMPTCAATDQTPDLILSESESVRFLLGPLALQCVSKVPPAKAPLLSAWLPLPLSWHPQDGI